MKNKILERKKMDMKNSVKRMFIMMLACVLVFSSVCVNNSIRAEAVAKVTKIKLNKKNLTINAGSSKKLEVSISPTKAKKRKVTWTSSNKKVATVKDGKVTGVSAGKATITAKAGGKKASCKVKVTLSKKAKQAIKAYQKFMGQEKIAWDANHILPQDAYRFILADVNADGIPEMILDTTYQVSHVAGYKSIYVFHNGEIQKSDLGVDEVKGYYPKKGIVVTETVMNGIHTYYRKIYKDGKTRRLGYVGEGININKYIWEWESKEVGREIFSKKLNKAVSNAKMVEVKPSDWYENTSKNRKNMEKLIKK